MQISGQLVVRFLWKKWLKNSFDKRFSTCNSLFNEREGMWRKGKKKWKNGKRSGSLTEPVERGKRTWVCLLRSLRADATKERRRGREWMTVPKSWLLSPHPALAHPHRHVYYTMCVLQLRLANVSNHLIAVCRVILDSRIKTSALQYVAAIHNTTHVTLMLLMILRRECEICSLQ